MTSSAVHLRLADRTDETAVRAMQERSIRVLGRDHYEPELIEAFIAHVGTMDASLLDEGRYFVAVTTEGIVASGGWSTARPGYAAMSGETGVHPVDGPVIRSIYVRPDAAGCGIGRWLMNRIEAEAAAAGHREVTLTAMLCAVDFYRRLGFTEAGAAAMRLPGNLVFRGTHMHKSLEDAAWRRRAA